MNHSPEPWFVKEYPDVVRSNCGLWIECPGPCTAQRIAACVNALAGVKDPDAFMRSVHSLVCAVKSSRLLTTPSLQAACDKVLEHREMEIPT